MSTVSSSFKNLIATHAQKEDIDNLHTALTQAKAIQRTIRTTAQDASDIAPTHDDKSLKHQDGYHVLNDSDHHSLVSLLIKSAMQILRNFQSHIELNDAISKFSVRLDFQHPTWTNTTITINRRDKDKDIFNISFERDNATGYFRPSFTLVIWKGEPNDMHNLLETNHHHRNYDVMFGIGSQPEYQIYGFPVYLIIAPCQPIKIDLLNGVFGDVNHTWKIVRVEESEKNVRTHGTKSLLPKWQEKHMIYNWKPDSWTMFFELQVKDSILKKGKTLIKTVAESVQLSL